jgi:hypothetical protein
MEPCPGIGGEADDVAGVGRYFRLEKDDVEHPWDSTGRRAGRFRG